MPQLKCLILFAKLENLLRKREIRLSVHNRKARLANTLSGVHQISNGTLNGIQLKFKINDGEWECKEEWLTQRLQLLVLSLRVNIKIESHVNFEKAFYYFGIAFHFTGFVTVLSLSFALLLSLHLYVLIFISPTFSTSSCSCCCLFLSLYYWLSNFRLCSFILTSSSIYISLHYISQMFSHNVFFSVLIR